MLPFKRCCLSNVAAFQTLLHFKRCCLSNVAAFQTLLPFKWYQLTRAAAARYTEEWRQGLRPRYFETNRGLTKTPDGHRGDQNAVLRVALLPTGEVVQAVLYSSLETHCLNGAVGVEYSRIDEEVNW